jgi:ADP-heptose:LPS heptosyltransferase
MGRRQKILAMQFKFLGDAVFVIPALRAIKESQPDCVLHMLTPREFAPMYQHLPWLDRIWDMPRVRGRARLKQSWPIICALRQERFDRSVDFAGNDRGAIMSLLGGARQRLGPFSPGSFSFRRFCYTQRVSETELEAHWIRRHLQLLSAWDIPPPRSLAMEIRSDPALDGSAAQLLPGKKIICHLTSGQTKKNWPVAYWAEFCKMAAAAGHELAFLTGRSPREQSHLASLKKLAPGVDVLPEIPDLAVLLAVMKRAKAFIAGDTGPLHCAAGLGVPVIGLFGITDTLCHTAPLYEPDQKLLGHPCECPGGMDECINARPCMAGISPADVMHRLQNILTPAHKS